VQLVVLTAAAVACRHSTAQHGAARASTVMCQNDVHITMTAASKPTDATMHTQLAYRLSAKTKTSRTEKAQSQQLVACMQAGRQHQSTVTPAHQYTSTGTGANSSHPIHLQWVSCSCRPVLPGKHAL
jgi:hypothetical protein